MNLGSNLAELTVDDPFGARILPAVEVRTRAALGQADASRSGLPFEPQRLALNGSVSR